MVSFFKKSWKKLIIILLILVILLSLFGVLFLDKYSPNLTNQISLINYKGYSELKAKITEVEKNQDIKSENLFLRFTNKLTEHENPDLSKEEKYKILKQAAILLMGAYSQTNNYELRELGDEFDKYVKENYSDLYQEEFFEFYCQDPICATDPQPKEINQIISVIKSSDFPDEIKESEIKELNNIGFLPRNNPDVVFNIYLMYAIKLRGYDAFTKTEANIAISEAVYKFLQGEFPSQYEKALNDSSLVKYGIKKL